MSTNAYEEIEKSIERTQKDIEKNKRLHELHGLIMGYEDDAEMTLECYGDGKDYRRTVAYLNAMKTEYYALLGRKYIY